VKKKRILNLTKLPVKAGQEVDDQISVLLRRIDFLEQRINSIENMLPTTISIVDNESKVIRLLNIIKPVFVRDLEIKHHGNVLDGGYPIAELLKPVSHLISFGIGNDSSFENSLAENNVRCYCYDHTIQTYPGLINHNIYFYSIGLAATQQNSTKYITLSTAIDMLKNSLNWSETNSLILKLDCEGAEWDALESIKAEELVQFDQLLIEFHDIKNAEAFEQYSRVFTKITDEFFSIGLYLNNHSETIFGNNLMITNTFEAHFVRKSLINVKNIYSPKNDNYLPNAPFRLSIHPKPIF
jgi:hypothetical protein